MKKGQTAGLTQAMEVYFAQEESRQRAEQQQAVRWITQNGLDALIITLREPSESPLLSRFATTVERERALKRIEDRRVTTLAELAPTVQRKIVSSVTIQDAVKTYLADLTQRVALKTCRRIDQTTSDTEPAASTVRSDFPRTPRSRC